MIRWIRRGGWLLGGFLLALPGAAEDPQGQAALVAPAVDEVTLELIMSHPDWLGTAPQGPYWSADGEAIYFERKRSGEELRDLYRIERESETALQVADEDQGSIDSPRGEWSLDRTRRVYSLKGDVFLRDLVQGEVVQLTRTTAVESSPRFLLDGRVAFERGGVLYVRDLETGLESQPVDLRFTDDPEEEDEAEDYLSRQQRRLFDVVQERIENRDLREDREREMRQADPSRPPLPWYLGKGKELVEQRLAPTGDWMAVLVSPESRDIGRRDKMPVFVTDDGYVEVRDVRPKVGTGDTSGDELWILDLVTREHHKIDLSGLPGILHDPLADLRHRVAVEAAERDEEEAPEAPAEELEKPRPVRVGEEGPFVFSPDGSRLAFQLHSVDNKDRWIGVVERTAPNEAIPVHHLERPGWVNWYFNEFGWLPDSRRLYFLSEETGYSNLYLHDLGSGETTALTPGEQVVSNPQLSPEGEHFVYNANPEHPGIYEVYRVAASGGTPEQLTRLGGRNAGQLSPDGETLLITHSGLISPPELYVQPARPGASARRLTHTISEAFLSLPWTVPEIVPVPSTHMDRLIYSRYYAPASTRGTGEDGLRPAVVFIHGAGYLQNAHQGWSGYFREFMFHTFLTQQGYAVLDLDYRGSAGYGADWREAIYRQMGTPELEDLEDTVAWMVENHGVDPKRVGVYGGSYGGFLTLMSLFKEPDLFAAGAALRPVTDWAHYNHPYTANILNTPEVDPWAYERSSPIEFAAGLEKPLLMCAPMLDDNVFFQDTVRLAQRLIELEKEHWEVAIFPVEPHGFRQPSSWLNEYRRIFRLFETHLAP